MSRTSSITYRPDIDGLRAIAVIFVVAFHASPYHITGGFVGVDVFFVISGYLISGIILKGVAAQNFSLADFYARRIKRIFPALLLVLLTCAGLGWFVLFTAEYSQLGEHIVSASAFLLNFELWREAGYFDYSATLKPLLHLWSLSIEEQFYIVWPAFLLLLSRSRWNFLLVISVVAAASFVFNVVLVGSDAVATFYMPLTRAWELMLGSLLACLELLPGLSIRSGLARFIARRLPAITMSWLREFCALAGAAMIGFAIFSVDRTNSFPGWWALLPTLGTFLIVLAGMDAWFNRQVLARKSLVFVGLISYPLYLWHWPLLSFAWLNANGDPPRSLRLAIVAVSFVLAWLTYVLLERRIRVTRTMVPVISLGVIACLVAGLGFSIVRAGGFASRSINANQVTASDIDPELITKFYQGQTPCFGKIGNPDFPFVCDRNSGSDPEIAVLGDSHAWALYPGIVSALPQHSMMRVGGCAFPSLGLTVFNKNINQFCGPDSNRKQLQLILETKSITTVILSFRGAIYTTGKGFGSGPRESDINYTISGSGNQGDAQDLASHVKTGVSTMIDALEAAQKRVVFVSDVAELGFDIPACISGRLFDKPKFPECRIPKSAVDARRKEYVAVIEALKLLHPRLSVFDAMNVLCDEAYCYGGRDHRYFYIDDNHLSIYGSSVVGGKLAAFLKSSGLIK